MRYVPVEHAKDTKVTVNGKEGTVKRHRVDDLVEVKLPNGRVVTVEARDVRKKG
jgi:ribosomal protein L6P/L9E